MSFLLFFVVFSLFLRNIFHKDLVIWNKDAGEMWYNDWRALAGAMLVSCVGIIVSKSTYHLVILMFHEN